MTIEEFKKRASEDEEWAPGWDIIDECGNNSERA